MTLKNILTPKIEILLTQKMLSMTNTHTANINQIYYCLQQENVKLQIQVQGFISELHGRFSARTPPM